MCVQSEDKSYQLRYCPILQFFNVKSLNIRDKINKVQEI